MTPKISIIIPFYNCPYVNQAIQSALDQTYDPIEIILVDDGSTAFVEKVTPYKDKIRYIRKENGGTATALNEGIHAATGEYIAWLSSDDYFLPDKISRQVNFMLRNLADFSFTNYDIIDKHNIVQIPRCGQRCHTPEEVCKAYLRYNIINGCTVMMKRQIFEKVGYFRPDLRYTQDYEMWFRLLANGYNLFYLDEVLTKFRSHEESGTHKFQNEMKREMAELERTYRPIIQKRLRNS